MTDIHTKKSDHDSYWGEFKSDFEVFSKLPRTIIAKKWLKEIKADFTLDIGCGPGYLEKLVKEATRKTRRFYLIMITRKQLLKTTNTILLKNIPLVVIFRTCFLLCIF